MGRVLVDTSVWVDFFRPEPSPVNAVVSLLVETGEAFYCSTVKAELLSGQASDLDPTTSWLFKAVPGEATLEADFERAGQLRRLARRSGHLASIEDALIAAVALRVGAEVYTLDKGFGKIPGLKLYEA